MLEKFANTLAGYKSGILAYYDYHISSGPLEGTNNNLKLANGFGDQKMQPLPCSAR